MSAFGMGKLIKQTESLKDGNGKGYYEGSMIGAMVWRAS